MGRPTIFQAKHNLIIKYFRFYVYAGVWEVWVLLAVQGVSAAGQGDDYALAVEFNE